MEQNLLIGIILIASTSLVNILATKLSVANPILLVIGGLILSAIPGLPAFKIDPKLISFFVVPAIIFEGTQNISIKAIWKWRRMISLLSIVFVILTSSVVAAVAVWLIPGFTIFEGFLLGAILSPSDSGVALAILKSIPIPKSITTILQGESLFNRAISLTMFRFALLAIATDQFIWSDAIAHFGAILFIGVATGLTFGALYYAIYKWFPTTANIDMALSLIYPYVIYLSAESLNASGALAVVAGGLFMEHHKRVIFSYNFRIKFDTVWPSLTSLLSSMMFLLIGLQLPLMIAGLKGFPFLPAVAISAVIAVTIILLRQLASCLSYVIKIFVKRFTGASASLGWRNSMVVSAAGIRGALPLVCAAAVPISLPDGQLFPHRDLFLFITSIIIIITLFGQGLALPKLVSIIKPEKI